MKAFKNLEKGDSIYMVMIDDIVTQRGVVTKIENILSPDKKYTKKKFHIDMKKYGIKILIFHQSSVNNMKCWLKYPKVIYATSYEALLEHTDETTSVIEEIKKLKPLSDKIAFLFD